MGRGRHKFNLRKNYEMALKVKIPLDQLVVSLPVTSHVPVLASNGQAFLKKVLVSQRRLDRLRPDAI